jgi:hypothetical protein
MIHFGGNTVRFSCDHAEILETLETHFRYCSTADGPVIANYNITTVSDSAFAVSLNGGDLFSNLSQEQVLWHLMQDAIMRLNGDSTELIFHAAALAHLDRGLILCGESGSGKSSLTAWLTASGLDYLTDEVISVPTQGEPVSGLTRSIVLKRGSAFIWQHWLPQPPPERFLQFKDGSAWIDPILFNANAIRQNITPRMLVFPKYIPEAGFHAEPLKQADALFRLLQCLVNARNFPDSSLAAASRLAQQVIAWQLTYSNIESATQWIQQTLAD